jgi:hypothetical protein
MEQRSPSIPRSSCWAVIAVTALGLAACGSSQAKDTAPPPPEPGIEPAEGADPDEPGVMPADEEQILEAPTGAETEEPDAR